MRERIKEIILETCESDFEIEKSLMNKLEGKIESFINGAVEEIEQCESPIEKLMLVEFNTIGLENTLYRKLYEKFDIFLVMPQTNISLNDKNYRADFLICAHNQEGPNFNFVVECDGFEHHSSKESFQKDRVRDRDLIANGYIPIHFSGSEIFNDAEKCVCDVYRTISEYIKNRHRY